MTAKQESKSTAPVILGLESELGKPRSEWTIEDLTDLFASRNIRILSLMHVGGDGWLKTLDFVPHSVEHLTDIIQGGDEKAKGEVQIKDLILGATLTSIEDRAEYLKQQAVAQFAVPEADLVTAVKGVLARQKA